MQADDNIPMHPAIEALYQHLKNGGSVFPPLSKEAGYAELEVAFALWDEGRPLRKLGIQFPVSEEYKKACEDFLFARTGARVGGNVTFRAWSQPRDITVERFEIMFEDHKTYEPGRFEDICVLVEGPTVYYKNSRSGPSFDESKTNIGVWTDLQKHYGRTTQDGRVSR